MRELDHIRKAHSQEWLCHQESKATPAPLEAKGAAPTNGTDRNVRACLPAGRLLKANQKQIPRRCAPRNDGWWGERRARVVVSLEIFIGRGRFQFRF